VIERRTIVIAHACAALVAIGADAAVACAQATTPVRTLTAVQATGPIRLDGMLSEPAWQKAASIRDFVQAQPVEGVPAEVPTEVRILYNAEAIYVGARLYERPDVRVARQLTRRGEEGDAVDWFEVSFDTDGDRRTAYSFRVTAAGVQADRIRYDDVRSDAGWDAVWDAAVHHDDEGWSVEFRIPLSQLRFAASGAAQSWGVNFARFRAESNELSFFALESRETFGGVSVFGRLDGLELRRRPRHLELRPYILAKVHSPAREAGNPFDSERGLRAGADVRYGLGSTFVLDLTVRPDFGQVEVDPAVINLTAFETFYPERRPFFSRDDRIFDFELTGARNNLFYSRRIGRRPQGGHPADADYAEMPTATTIVSAAKVTGRTARGLSIGALAAATARESGRAFGAETEEFWNFDVEPSTRYGVLRAQQELRGGESRVGAMLTATDRRLEDGSLLAAVLPARAVTGGLDFEHTWGDRGWELLGVVATSRVTGSAPALLRLQRSPAHYFQRPDTDYLVLDSAATSLAGTEWRLQLSRRSGQHWTWSAWTGQRTPGFDVNDVGFGPEGERLHAGGRIAYQQITPGRRLRAYRISLFGYNRYRHELLDAPFTRAQWAHALEQAQVNGSVRLTFPSYRELDFDLRFKPQYLNGVLTRGGPRMIDPATVQLELGVGNDRRSRIHVRPTLLYGEGLRGGVSTGAALQLTLRPADWIRLGVNPEYRRVGDPRFYVATAQDAAFEETFGARYLFADFEHRIVSFEARADVLLSPRLSFQLYAQPLVSSGVVNRYKQLAAPASFTFENFSEGTFSEADAGVRCIGGRTCEEQGRRFVDFNGDGIADFDFAARSFAIRSLRSSSVLRWEYRPGAVVYAVWQHGRFGRTPDGRFEPIRQLHSLWQADMENTVIIKVNYWLGY
jgi:hypothetical protein